MNNVADQLRQNTAKWQQQQKCTQPLHKILTNIYGNCIHITLGI